MNEARKITLAGQEYPVEALPFGRLKQALPAMMWIGRRLSASELTEADVDAMGNVVAWGIGLDTLGDMRVRFGELIAAFQAVTEVSGLVETAPGEATGPSSTGTSSTPTS